MYIAYLDSVHFFKPRHFRTSVYHEILLGYLDYMKKLGYEKVDAGVYQEQAECYVRAIQWNLHYYYDGCISWSWFYPHHFAPWITDIKNFVGMKMNFEMSKPFLPFEQLMAVLPAASMDLIPQVRMKIFCFYSWLF